MDQIIKYVLSEIRVISEAPVAFSACLLVLAGVIWWAVNWRYSGVIDSKDGIIALYKERLNGATPDQARAKIEGLEAQISALRSREWAPLTASTSAAFKAALKDMPPTEVEVFTQDRDGINLVRSLIAALNELGWQAKRNASINPLPDGLTVWPMSESARQVRNALASATGAPVNLVEHDYYKNVNHIAIGVGFKVD
jgi:hypothetical protein